MEQPRRAEDLHPLERIIGRLLEASRRSLREGNPGRARGEVDGAAALRRVVDRMRSA
jgi:hypothetical protein